MLASNPNIGKPSSFIYSLRMLHRTDSCQALLNQIHSIYFYKLSIGDTFEILRLPPFSTKSSCAVVFQRKRQFNWKSRKKQVFFVPTAINQMLPFVFRKSYFEFRTPTSQIKNRKSSFVIRLSLPQI